MLTWIILILLVLVPWAAPAIERVCSNYAGFGQMDAEPDPVGPMQLTGHLQRAKAEGAGWLTDARAQGDAFETQMRALRAITSR